MRASCTSRTGRPADAELAGAEARQMKIGDRPRFSSVQSSGMPAKKYDESSVKKLRGIEPVQRLPGMYTRTTDPTHIIQEAIDNAADEAFGSHADKIDVTVHRDGSVSVADNGRGIPVGLHPEEKIPTVQLVFTELHAGAKFSKSEADAAYKFSGGLHGVGVSVTNALSDRLEVEVRRESALHRIVFQNGAVTEKLKKTKSVPPDRKSVV